MYANRRHSSILQEIGVEEHEVTSDFRPEVEIWPFCAYAMNIMHCLRPNCKNNNVLLKIGAVNTMMSSDFRPEIVI